MSRQPWRNVATMKARTYVDPGALCSLCQLRPHPADSYACDLCSRRHLPPVAFLSSISWAPGQIR